MNKKLQFEIPQSVTFQYNAYTLGMILANQSIKNVYYNEVLQLYFDRSSFIFYYSPLPLGYDVSMQLYNMNCLKRKDIFDYVEISRSCHKKDIISTIEDFINEERYVHLSGIDPFYISNTPQYMRTHIGHDILIFGYHQEKRKFLTASYTQNQQFEIFEIPYDDISQTFYKGHPDYDVHIAGIKPKENLKVDFSFDSIQYWLKQYLTSVNTLMMNDTEMDPYLRFQNEYVFGINIHRYLWLYLDYIEGEKLSWLDPRVMRMFWEHKKIMLDKIKIMAQLNPVFELYIDDVNQIEITANILKNLSLKYRLNNDKKYIGRCKEIILEIYQREMDIWNRVLEKL